MKGFLRVAINRITHYVAAKIFCVANAFMVGYEVPDESAISYFGMHLVVMQSFLETVLYSYTTIVKWCPFRTILWLPIGEWSPWAKSINH